MSALQTFEVDGVEWTEYEWVDEEKTVFQRVCPDCDHGMLWAPARFHGACAGSGFLVSHADPREEVE